LKIVGIEGLTPQQLRAEVDRGARFVIYGYCLSFVVVTLRRSSDITFVRADRSPAVAGLGWTALSFFLGWWGFPWGFIYTPMVIFQNLSGGKDVTREVMMSLGAEQAPAAALGPAAPVQSPGALEALGSPPAAPAPGTSLGARPLPPAVSTGRETAALLLSIFSLACCAPLGWIGAILAILSIRDARASGRSAPGMAIASLVLAGLSTAAFVVGVGAVGYDTYKAGRNASRAASDAASGRLRDTLDARTACALAEEAIWRGDDNRWDSVECNPPLTNDPSTPALDVTMVSRRTTRRATVCFARSNVRWYALSIREHTTCPPAPALEVPAGASTDELDRLERDAMEAAVFAPNPPVRRPVADEPDEPAEPEIEVIDEAFARTQLLVSNRVTGRQPSFIPPFHAAGGDWTYFDVATNWKPECTVRIGLKQPPKGEGPFTFTEAVLVPLDRKRSRCFVEVVARDFFTAMPEATKRPGKLTPVRLTVAVLGQNMVRDRDGFFTEPPKGKPGSWLTTKLFLEKGDVSAEVFFNLDTKFDEAELTEKDAGSREALVDLLSKALIDGW
jgi:hypothetical protein